jgi:iron complex outermembrane receptor protein
VFGAQRPAFAQQGVITGRAIDAESNEPVSGVSVEVVVGSGRALHSETTNAQGEFRFAGVADGRYSLVFSSLGYETKRVDGVRVVVGEGAVSVGTVILTSVVFRLNPIVVTASRTQEKALDSPSSVYTVEAEAIEERTTTTTVDHIRALPGADVVTTGLSQHNVVARGFNNVFSGALFVLTDNRWASVPSLRFNAYNLIPATNEDIDRIEFVLGPGSSISLAGGGRAGNAFGSSEGIGQLSFRHAGLIGDKVGYKLSGMYFKGTDWEYIDPIEQLNRDAAIAEGADPDTLLIGRRDFDQERFSGDLRFDFTLGDQTTLILNGGASRMVSSIEMTGIGAAQALDWTYTYFQGRILSGDLFAQAYVNLSDAGDSFTLRDADLVSDNSLLYVGQIQHGVQLGERQRFTYGADMIRTVPRTDGSINGRNEDDDNILEVGGYLQSETQLSPMFDLVLAGRVDYHDVVDQVLFSPRAALVVKPTEEHSLRFTYNRAFSQPSSNNLFLDKLSSPDLGGLPFPVRGRGAPSQGFNFRRDCTTSAGVTGLCMRSPFTPGALGGPITSLPLDATMFWDAAVQIVGAQDPQAGAILGLMAAPTASQVGSVMRALNPTTFGFDLVNDVANVPQTNPMITNTIEGGYKGLLGDRFLVGLDVYYTKVEDFVGPLLVETPNVFMEPASLGAYIASEAARLGLPLQPADIAALTEGMARVPVAAVTPEEVDPTIQNGLDPTTIILTYRNFPNFDLWGADLGATFIVTEWLSLMGSYSYVSENFFTADELGAPRDLALNSPKNKASLGATYRNERFGLVAEARGRYVEAFPVKTGVYVSSDAVGQDCATGTCLEDYALLDINLSYALPISRSTVVTVTGTNVLNNKHLQMIGAPELASLWLMRVRQSF